MTALVLLLAAFAGFAVEAAAGFGSTLVAVGIGAQFVPVERLLAALLPVNVLLSAWIVLRERRHVAMGPLTRRLLPLLGAGMLLGRWAGHALGGEALKLLFATFVVLLSMAELKRLASGMATAPSALSARLLLLGGGLIHGLFACGGPLVVYVLGREIDDKRVFRATLSALWLVLNLVFIGGLIFSGTMQRDVLRDASLMMIAMVLGAVAGEWLHHRVPERRFRQGVYALLVVAGASLAVGTLTSWRQHPAAEGVMPASSLR